MTLSVCGGSLRGDGAVGIIDGEGRSNHEIGFPAFPLCRITAFRLIFVMYVAVTYGADCNFYGMIL